MNSESVDRHQIRTLLISLAAGTGMFVIGFFLIIFVLTAYGHLKFDPSVIDFYPLIAGAGALFGFERWWYNESGGVNPFH